MLSFEETDVTWKIFPSGLETPFLASELSIASPLQPFLFSMAG